MARSSRLAFAIGSGQAATSPLDEAARRTLRTIMMGKADEMKEGDRNGIYEEELHDGVYIYYLHSLCRAYQESFL